MKHEKRTELLPSINRETHEPGGCACSACGAIFIGGPDDDLCGRCWAKLRESDRAVMPGYVARKKRGQK